MNRYIVTPLLQMHVWAREIGNPIRRDCVRAYYIPTSTYVRSRRRDAMHARFIHHTATYLHYVLYVLYVVVRRLV